ncbi:uncharacterized protein LOC127752323 [Frankliniella occidentalis]|uniref:Uncharacterized protein LOC127752323 n=1 Tax=Frankliniella occidentalis TaxID=133901 RepID=A0A9C6XWI6_FRAOC|nr:uncharacterized protein LOC127752323 [Frankliniella occidentalis]
MDSFVFKILTTAVVLRAASGGGIPTFAGPWNVWIERFTTCSEDDKRISLKISHFNPSKKFENQVWNGFINFTEEMDDTWWSKGVLDVRSNNQWKENAFVFFFPKNGCSSAREILTEMFSKYFGKKGTPCRLVKRCIYFENTTVAHEYPRFPIMPYGYYRFKITAGVTGAKEPEYCFRMLCHIIPKIGS